MKKNTVKEKLRAGKPSVGSWLSLCSPIAAEHMAHVGFDWLVVDTEHSPVGFETTVHCFQAICTTDTVPMARVAWNDPMLMKRLLDAGAMGLVVPMVKSAEEARQAVAAMKYPPKGFRSVGGGRCSLYGDDYFERANDEIAVVVQIEHMDAVKAAEEILSVEGVDAGFIGPNDLAASMGIGLRLRTFPPEHEAAIMRVLEAGRKTGTAVGIHCPTPAAVNMRIQQGFQFIALAGDLRFMNAAVRSDFAQLKLG